MTRLPRSLASVLTVFLLGAGLLLIGSPEGRAQELPLTIETPLPGVDSYDESIPRPEQVIGHRIGARHTAPHEVVDYFEAVAEVSDRVRLESHGETHGGRRLIHALVSAPERLDRIDEVRAANRRLSEEPGAISDTELEAMPAVIYMGYSIHGDEASGTEAALLLLYHLAAGEGPAVEEALRDLVTIVDPLLNPDGRDRFVDWVNDNRGGVPIADPRDREHNQPWPGGRTNHYWFDLNRDWMPAQHPTSRGRLEVFHSWRPQLLLDFHEMGSEATYFFQPGVPSRTNPNTSARNQALTGEIATYHADYLDRIGSLYYTRETYDDFYYGKGSTFPDANGSIGILFEQASSRALERETSKGIVHYDFTVRNQFLTSLSTIEAAVEMRDDLLDYQRDFYAEAPSVADEMTANAYLVDLAERPTRARALARLLDRHRIELYRLARTVEAGGRTFRANEAYVVPLRQRQGRYAKALFERTTSFPDSIFYDVSTWTLPLAYGVKHAAYAGETPELLGPQIEDPAFAPGSRVGGEASYAYAIEWNRYFAPRALYRFQDAGVRPRLMTEPFSAVVDGEQRTFDRGTVVVPLSQRKVPEDTIHALAERIPDRDHLDVYALETGLTPEGPDLGSGPSSHVLARPEIGVLTGGRSPDSSYVSAYDAGEVWHLLTERFEVPVSLLDVEELPSGDLGRYDVLVLAGGWYDDLPTRALDEWIADGGRLVVLDDAVHWAVDRGRVDLEERSVDVDSLVAERPYAELDRARGAQELGGSIFEVHLDTTHPLAFGYERSVPVFRSGETFYDPSGEPGATVGSYAEEEPLLSGYVSEEVGELVPGGAAIEAHPRGDGAVILLAFDPDFRAFWWGTNGLFLNAVFLGGVL